MTSVMDNCNAIWQFQYSPLIQLFFHSSRQVFNISSSLWKSPLSSLSSADDSTFHLIMKIKIFGTELQQFSPITFIHLPFFCTKVSGIMISLPYFTKNKLLVLPSLIFLCVYWLLFFFFFHLLKDIISVILLTFSCTELILLANNHGVISLLLKLKVLSWLNIDVQLLINFSSFLHCNGLQTNIHPPFSPPNVSQMYSGTVLSCLL